MTTHKGACQDFFAAFVNCLGVGVLVLVVFFLLRDQGEPDISYGLPPHSSRPEPKQQVRHQPPPNEVLAASDRLQIASDPAHPRSSKSKLMPLAHTQASELVQQAHTSLQSGDSASAEALLQRVLAGDPHNVQALKEMGMVELLGKQDPSASIAYFEAAASLEPSHQALLDGLVDIYHVTGRLDQGRAFLKQLATQDPGNLQLARSLGRSYALSGQFQEASTTFKQTTQKSPADSDYAESFAELAELQAEAGDLPGAVASYYESLRTYDSLNYSESTLARRTMLDVKYIRGLVRLGREHEAKERIAVLEKGESDQKMLRYLRQELNL